MNSFFATTTTLLVITFAFDVINAYSDGVQQLCSEGEFFSEDTEQCESCAECTHAQFESHRCTPFQNTVCRRCRATNVKKNADYYIRCILKRFRSSGDEKMFVKKFRTKFVESIFVVDDKVSDEVVDVEELPDRRTLPPLPADDEYDDEEYDDNDILAPIQLGLPSSEEELVGKDILLRGDIPPLDNKDDNEKRSEESKLVPISTDERLRDEESNDQNNVEKEFDEDKVQPINVNEGKIGQDDEISKEDVELLHHNDRISIVAIAFRNKQSQDKAVSDGAFSSTYTSLCHTMGIYLYLATFIVLLGILLKRCYKTSNRVPEMHFTDDQRAMINRCAHNLKKKGKWKGEAFYDNDIAYV